MLLKLLLRSVRLTEENFLGFVERFCQAKALDLGLRKQENCAVFARTEEEHLPGGPIGTRRHAEALFPHLASAVREDLGHSFRTV